MKAIFSRLMLGGVPAVVLLAGPAFGQQLIGKRDALLTVSDYPPKALAARQEGSVTVGFTITPEGTVADCKTIYAKAPQDLIDGTCAAITTRARYIPARDVAGKAISARDFFWVSWKASPPAVTLKDFGGSIPQGRPGEWATDNDYNKIVAAVGTADVEVLMRIGPAGRIVACGVERSSGNQKLDDYTCALLASRARFTQPVDEHGNPMTTLGRTTVHWQKPDR